MEVLFSILISVILISLGFFSGSLAERRHFRHLQRREMDNIQIVQSNSKQFLAPRAGTTPPTLILAETVIASDYFKNFLSAFRKFFGGEMRSYHSLMERARREVTAKLVEQARSMGYNAICNLRLEPADIGGNLSKKGSVMVGILGSATAYHSDVAVDIQRPAVPPLKT